MSIRDAAQALLDSLDRPDSAVERLMLEKYKESLRKALSRNRGRK